jgi:type IV pilus assembly protein PilE
MNRNQSAFTLIELMIVVTIIGILAAIAYPSYQNFVKRSNRAGAKTALLEDAQFLERNFTTSNRYDQDSAGNAVATASLPVQQTPREGGTAKYTITVIPTASTYTLRATPAGSMAGDGCGNLTLDNTGQKGRSGSGISISDCWNR